MTQGHSVAVDASGRHITVAGFTHSSNFPTTANAYRSTCPTAWLFEQRLCDPVRIEPARFPVLHLYDALLHLPGGEHQRRPGRHLRRRPGSQGAHRGHGPDAVGGLSDDRWGRPTIFNSAPYLKAGTSGDEPYLVKIDPALNGDASLVYSTFLGGGSADGKWGSFCTSVGVDSRGTVYVAGETYAPGVQYVPSDHPVEAPQEFPYTPDALFTALQGSYDAIFMQIDPGGATLGYSTYLGGKDSDRTYGLAVDPAGNVVLTGLTFSADFPLKNPAQTWPGNAGCQNAFVTKFSARARRPIGSLLLLLLDD